jgi:hypothetical protein
VAWGPVAAEATPEILSIDLDVGQRLPGDTSSSPTTFEKVFRAMGAAAVPGLIAALEGDDPKVRERAFRACRLLGPDVRPALPALRSALAAKRIPGWEEDDVEQALSGIEWRRAAGAAPRTPTCAIPSTPDLRASSRSPDR